MYTYSLEIRIGEHQLSIQTLKMIFEIVFQTIKSLKLLWYIYVQAKAFGIALFR